MGREIRMVQPGWEHPRFDERDCPSNRDIGRYRPCYDEDYEASAKKWLEASDLWRTGSHPDQPSGCKYYWEWAGTPDEELCRPAFTSDPTWYQLYETVSEGTPVSPPFATPEELAIYLADNGDFWYQMDQRRGRDSFRTKPTYEQAMGMIDAGWMPSMMMVGGKMLEPHQINELKDAS